MNKLNIQKLYYPSLQLSTLPNYFNDLYAFHIIEKTCILITRAEKEFVNKTIIEIKEASPRKNKDAHAIW